MPKAAPSLYNEAIQKIEGIISQAALIVLKFCVPMYTMPKCFVSYYEYFLQDASESAFQLTYDKTYVSSIFPHFLQ